MARFFLVSLLPIIIVSSGCGGLQRDTLGHQQEEARLYLGDSISATTQATLLAYVSQAIQAGGTGHAVDFCNIHAMQLTDSLAQTYGVSIQRLSDRNRNLANALRTKTDKTAWKSMQGAAPEHAAHLLLDDSEGNTHYYKPIFIAMPTCLQCHGKPQEDVATGTLQTINEKYPDDKALGYALGELRGVWKITWTQNN